MNTTTNKQDETLEEAAKKYSPARAGVNSYPEKKAFIAGANWQKEQDKVIIDKLIDTLGNALSILEEERNYIGVSLYKSYAPYYDKAKELLQSLK